ncbi:synaptobrevin, longin-like domain protein [Tanacetum coccineum]
MARLKYCDKHNQVGFLRKPDESAGFAEIVDFLIGSNLRYALTTNPTIHDSLVKQFWQTATAKTLTDGTLELHKTIDTIVYTITEASIRNKLQLADASGITMLPNNEIFEGMGHMGYPTDGSFTFWKSFFTPHWRFLVHHILHCISSKSGGWDQFGSNIATALICLSTGKVYNFSKLIFNCMVANLKSKTKFLMYPRFLQMILDIQTENKHPYLAVTLTKKIFGNMKRGFRGVPRPLLPAMLSIANPSAGQEAPSVTQPQPSSSVVPPTPSTTQPIPSEAITIPPLCQPAPPTPIVETTNASLSPTPSPKQLKETKQTFGKAILTLVERVKILKVALKRKTKRILLSGSKEEEIEDQGRKFHDLDPLVSLLQELVTPSKTPSKTINASGEEQVEDISPTTLEVAAILIKVKKIKSVDKGKRYKRMKSSKESAGIGLDFEEVKSVVEEVNASGIKVSAGIKEINTGSLDVNTGKLKESVLEKDLTVEDYAKRMVELVNQRRKCFAEERARAKRNKPMTQTRLRNYMSNFLKNQGTWKLTQLKKLNFEEVKAEFEKLDTYVPMNFEATKESLKRFGEELQTKTAKKLKFDDEGTQPTEEKVKEDKDDKPTKKTGKRRKQIARKGLHTDHDRDESEDSDEANEKDDSTSGTNIPINPVPVATKLPSIANYKIIKQGRKGVYQIVRENGTDMVYISFGAMLTDISRDDLTELYRIVMKKHGMNEPEDEFEKVLWEYLKNMFEEPLSTDSIWSLPGQQRIICWRYYDACRVHCLNLESVDVYMLIERKYPLSAEVCKAMLDKKLQGGKPDEDCYKLLKMMEKQAGIRKHKDWLVQEQTALGKDFSNPLMADNLPKIVWLSTHHINTIPLAERLNPLPIVTIIMDYSRIDKTIDGPEVKAKDAIIASTWNLVDRSLTSAKIKPLSGIVPSTINTKYSVELADGKVIGIDTISCSYSPPLGDETLTNQSNKSNKYASIFASEQRDELFDRIDTLEQDNLRLGGMLCVEINRVDHLRRSTIIIQKEKVIAYDSRQLKVYEENYPTHDLELGEIVFSFKIWEHYLYGIKHTMFTNHKSLQHILDQKELNMRPHRLLRLLSDSIVRFDITLEKESVAADALSKNDRAKPLRVRALVMTINLNLLPRIHEARVEAPKKENVKDENFHADEPLAIPLDEIQDDDKLNFIEEPVEVMDREVKRLKQSRIPIVKVMAISVISISSDSSEDSVGTPAGRVILFGTIPTTIPDTTPVITPPLLLD